MRLNIDRLFNMGSLNTYFIIFSILVFPSILLTVKHGGGVIYNFLALFGLFSSISIWRGLEQEEKRVFKAWAFFALFLVLTLVYSEDYREGLKEIETYSRIVLAIAISLYLIKYGNRISSYFVFSLIIAGIILGLVAWYGDGRASGSYNPIKYGQFSALVSLYLLCAALFSPQKYKIKIFTCLSLFFGLYASLASGTRSAWMTIILCALFLILIKSFQLNFRRNMILYTVIVVFSSGIYLVNEQIIDDRVINTGKEVANVFNNLSGPQQGGGLDARYSIWLDNLSMWRNNPVLGVGIGAYRKANEDLIKSGKSVSPHRFYDPHSVYFSMLVVVGIIGFIVFLLCVIFLPLRFYWLCYRQSNEKEIRFIVLCGVITILAYCFFGITENWLGANVLVNAFFFYSGLFLANINSIKSQNNL